MTAFIRLRHLAEFADKTAETLAPEIDEAGHLIADAVIAGHRVLVCGNGGSATQACHFAAELVGRFRCERQPIPAISLTDVAVITAIGNDYTFADVFVRQVQAYGDPGDVLVCLSTSGRSVNVLNAAERARHLGMRTVAILGRGAPEEWNACDVVIRLPTQDTALVQELSESCLHTIAEIVEREVCGEG